LSAPDYEVRTEVPPDIFAAFVSIIEGGPITLSDDTCDFLRLLSLEFRFKALSKACSEFMGLTESFSETDESSSDEDSDEGEVDVGPGHAVTIIYEDRFRRYDVFRCHEDALHFAVDLEHAKQRHIAIDGMKWHHRIVERAVAAVYANTLADFPDDDVHKGLLLLILWDLQVAFYDWNLGASIYCANRAHEITQIGFDEKRLMFLSQCDPARPDEFVPLPNANPVVMGNVICMMRKEKNGKTKEAERFLRKLEDSGRYNNAFALRLDSDW
jgi:hypothetical protein